ncbi:unnamed protein product [Heterobilharzia americana]|nr:unnamed protein product [Heterobilharzia americana]CAH8551648.1 unnamed protein product [Heterobilharzia americana]
MSKSVSGKRKGKGKGKKGKTKDPMNDALEKAQKDVKNLRGEISQKIFIAENAENRCYQARIDNMKSVEKYEEIKMSTQNHTAFLVTENEMKVANLRNEMEKLSTKLNEANQLIELRNSQLENLNQEFEKCLAEKDLKINSLEQKLQEQTALFRDVISQAFNQLIQQLQIDYENVHKNFSIFSQSTSDLVEFEFLNPPFLDEESTEYI